MARKRHRSDDSSSDGDDQRRAQAPSARLPLEVIRQIAMDLAYMVCRSAVTAALLHPTFTKKALHILSTSELVVRIDKPATLDSWIRKSKTFETEEGHLLVIDTLRLIPSLSSPCRPKEQLVDYLHHFLQEKPYMIDYLEVMNHGTWSLPYSEQHNYIRSLTLRQVSEDTFEPQKAQMMLNSLTLIDPIAIPTLSHNHNQLGLIYIVFSDDQDDARLYTRHATKQVSELRSDALDLIHRRRSYYLRSELDGDAFEWDSRIEYFMGPLFKDLTRNIQVFLIAVTKNTTVAEDTPGVLFHKEYDLQFGHILHLVQYQDDKWEEK